MALLLKNNFWVHFGFSNLILDLYSGLFLIVFVMILNIIIFILVYTINI